MVIADDLSWLSLLPNASELESLEELLDQELHDAVPIDAAVLIQSPTTALWTASSPSRSLQVAEATTQTAKRPRSMRPKEEIGRLRQSVAELEHTVQLLGREAHQGLKQEPLDMRLPSDSSWRDIAWRQYERLRESQCENEQLRSQVKEKLNVLRKLVELLQRAQRVITQLPMDTLSMVALSHRAPPLMDSADASMFLSKRKELSDMSMQMLRGFDFVFGDKRYESTPEESSDVILCNHWNDGLPPGMPLGTGSVRRLVPGTVAPLSESLWASDLGYGIPPEIFQSEVVEETPDRQTLQLYVNFQDGESPIRFYGVVVRLRDRNSPSHAFVTTSSMWPSRTNPSPWNCVGVDMKQWLIVQARDDSPACPLTDVLLSLQVSKLARPCLVAESGEAGMMLDFAVRSVDAAMERVHRHVDSVLLGRTSAIQ